MSKAKCIMVQGTMSGAGKSLLCAALCRIFAQDGYRVAPFKSQNMALNSFVTRDGLEMGRAQVVQAQAAGIEPDVRMNPILLKPSSDVGSQVIVNGEVRGQMPAAAYFKMKRALIPEILSAYNSLAETVDIIVIEGAGSPAEINLKADDIVNMGLARLVDAPVLLAGDIDRGGVFAQLYGTVALLEPEERARIKGLLINKFRGDVEILRPGLAMLEEKTQLPVLGVVPYLKVDIEDEDSLSTRLDAGKTVHPLDAAILRLPHISNFTDFMPLEQHPLLGVRYVQNTRQLGTPDLIILPGTKNTVDDLLWLRQSGLEAALLKLAANGTPVLGVCGGYQMLGETLADPEGTESGTAQTVRGLGLLPTHTVFTGRKHRTQDTAAVTAASIRAFASSLLVAPRCRVCPSAHWQTAHPRAACRTMCSAPTCTACLIPVNSPRSWWPCSAGARALRRTAPPSSRWSSTASSSLTCWPMACAARWIWMPFTRPWGWRTHGGMHNDPTTSSARRH